jgi:hypothetical protein
MAWFKMEMSTGMHNIYTFFFFICALRIGFKGNLRLYLFGVLMCI